MKPVKIAKPVAIVLYSLMLCVTLVIACMLMRQYQFFLKEATELMQVKDSYYQHVDMLKRSLNASISGNVADYEEDLDEPEDKKKNEVELAPLEKVSTDSKPALIITTSEPEFALISPDEESRLNLIKKQLQKIQTAHSSKKLTKKVLKPLASFKHQTRYAPVRDFNFIWPIDLAKFWLSSLYGPRRLANGQVKFHYAIDMAALKGTAVKAAAPGKITIAQHVKGYGNFIEIYHNERYKTRYAHLDTIMVQAGEVVKQGQLIGTVGDTGFVRKSGKDASHLHFEIYQDGQRVNPLKFLFT